MGQGTQMALISHPKASGTVREGEAAGEGGE
jgi:hypothetical protein